ncbi:transcriptional regulator, LysR family [Rhizobiales bacterium GAS188]|nr:transcriptional regulator, LysR family [Rhizobiales bacterium GAS188]
MDRLDAMAIFASVVDEGSFAGAARRLRRSPPSVTRAIAFLEQRVGATLLHRSTRAMRLTQAGERYLVACRNVLAELASAERSVGSEQAELQGVVAVTSPATFGRLHVRPVMDGFLDAHRGVSLRLLLLDRIVNLVEEGFDVAIRIGHLPDSSLSSIRLGQVRRVLCASPDYLARHPPLLRPVDLARHACIVISQNAADQPWRFSEGAGGRQRPVRLHPRLNVNEVAAAVASAAEGHGIVRLMSYQAESEMRAGRLARLLPEFESAPLPVHLLAPAERPPTARIRALIDYAVPVLRAILTKVEATFRR